MDLNSLRNNSNPNDSFSYREKYVHRHDVAESIIWSVSSVSISLLGFRFIFALLGANPVNGFDSFVNGLTAPFVSPFYSLFSYDHPSLGVATFEGYTLIAMAAYAVLATVLSRLVSITRY